MNTIAIDTHKTIEMLKKKGYTQDQAEGFVDALVESNLVNKADLEVALEKQTAVIVKWVSGMLIAQAALIVALLQLFV